MSWGVISEFVAKVRTYSTFWGQVWWILMFVFRMMVVAIIGNQVYGDEQGAFKCDTLQPGCAQVCFNRFSPIGHMRFWSFQILFIAIPAVFYYMFAGSQLNYVKLLEDAEKRRNDAESKRNNLKQKIAKYETEESEIGNNSVRNSDENSTILEKRTEHLKYST